MPKPKTPTGKNEASFFQALQEVIDKRFRRLETSYTDTKGHDFQVSIYRCLDNLVRVDFKD